ncbi:MAG: hypothetical protein PHD24_03675 [Candidatus Izemoplasmatales bacterium]|nr:hypothetical protein [Candidatus Izemoplasmatales bacterium]MDD4595759.1 hypothetical protein [Candidatus Izemoplasmatales bacterium]
MKNFLSKLFVDNNPERKEEEYLSTDQTAESVKKLKSFALIWIVVSIWFIFGQIGSIIKLFIDFPLWVEIIYSFVNYGGLISLLILFSIMYLNLKKYAKEISKDIPNNGMSDTKHEYFVVDFLFRRQHTFCIWYFPENSDNDFLVEEDGSVITFKNIDSAISYAKSMSMKLGSKQIDTVYNLNHLKELASHLASDFDCSEVINIWNMTDALCNTIHVEFHSNQEEYDHVYNELMGGCNTAVNATIYHPIWNENDLKTIETMLDECLHIIRKHVIKH